VKQDRLALKFVREQVCPEAVRHVRGGPGAC